LLLLLLLRLHQLMLQLLLPPHHLLRHLLLRLHQLLHHLLLALLLRSRAPARGERQRVRACLTWRARTW
jgi:hypothetical protein